MSQLYSHCHAGVAQGLLAYCAGPELFLYLQKVWDKGAELAVTQKQYMSHASDPAWLPKGGGVQLGGLEESIIKRSKLDEERLGSLAASYVQSKVLRMPGIRQYLSCKTDPYHMTKIPGSNCLQPPHAHSCVQKGASLQVLQRPYCHDVLPQLSSLNCGLTCCTV